MKRMVFLAVSVFLCVMVGCTVQAEKTDAELIAEAESAGLKSPCENTTLILLAIEISVPWRSVLPGR